MSMNEPQIWTLIGIFGAALLGGFTLVTSHFGKVVRAEIGRLEGALTGKLDALDGRLTGQIESLEGRLNGRIDLLDHRLDTLDKEVANLATKVWRSS